MSLSQDQMGELQACFQTFDAENKGQLTVEECAMAMRSLGYDLPPNQLGQVDQNRFVQLASQHIVVVDKQPKLTQALLCFDYQGQGWADLSQMKWALQNLGEKMSPQEIQDFERQVQAQQGQVNCQQAAARLTFK